MVININYQTYLCINSKQITKIFSEYINYWNQIWYVLWCYFQIKELNNLLYTLTGLSNNLSSVRSIKIRDPRLYSSDPPKAVTSSLGVRTDKKGISLVAFFVSVRWSLVSKLYTLPASKDIDVFKDDITFLLIRLTENIFKENHKYYIINLAFGIFFLQ